MDNLKKQGLKQIIGALLCIGGAFAWMAYQMYTQEKDTKPMSLAQLESGQRIPYDTIKLTEHWALYDKAKQGKRYIFVPLLSDTAYTENKEQNPRLVMVLDANESGLPTEALHESSYIGKYSSLGVAESDFRSVYGKTFRNKVYAFRPTEESISISNLEMNDWLPAAIGLFVGFMLLINSRSRD